MSDTDTDLRPEGPQSFAEWLRAKAAETGKSQAEISRHLGITDGAVSKMFAGLIRPRAGGIFALFDFLEATPADREIVSRLLQAEDVPAARAAS